MYQSRRVGPAALLLLLQESLNSLHYKQHTRTQFRTQSSDWTAILVQCAWAADSAFDVHPNHVKYSKSQYSTKYYEILRQSTDPKSFKSTTPRVTTKVKVAGHTSQNIVVYSNCYSFRQRCLFGNMIIHDIYQYSVLWTNSSRGAQNSPGRCITWHDLFTVNSNSYIHWLHSLSVTLWEANDDEVRWDCQFSKRTDGTCQCPTGLDTFNVLSLLPRIALRFKFS